MRKYVLVFLSVLLLVLPAMAAMAQGQETQSSPQTETQAPQAGNQVKPAQKPPRVVGQPQTEAEKQAWTEIEQAATIKEKAELAKKFLQNYPDSGLTPFAQQLLAFSYQQANDFQNFVLEGEKTLEELPNNPLLLTNLAVAYAQKNEPDKAIDRAQKALQLIGLMQKPNFVSPGQWAQQTDQLQADAHYALGLSYVDQYVRLDNKQQVPTAPVLAQAAEQLEEAVKLDPGHDRSYYHLGFVYAKHNKGIDSINCYARAVALNGIAAAPARVPLEKVYKAVHKNTDGVDAVIAKQREYVQQKMAEAQAKYNSLGMQPAQPSAQPPQQQPAPLQGSTPTPHQ